MELLNVLGRLFIMTYWQPNRIEGLRCYYGHNCEFGICDECQRTHNNMDPDVEEDNCTHEAMETTSDTCSNNF